MRPRATSRRAQHKEIMKVIAVARVYHADVHHVTVSDVADARRMLPRASILLRNYQNGITYTSTKNCERCRCYRDVKL